MRRGTQYARIESPAAWWFVNYLIYLAIVVVTFVGYVWVAGIELGRGLSEATVIWNFATALPAILVLMLLPTGVTLAILRNVHMRTTWRYRIVAVTLLLLPVALAWFSLEVMLYVAVAQLTFAALMIVSPQQSAP